MIRKTIAILLIAMLTSSCAAWKEQWQKRYPTQATSTAGEVMPSDSDVVRLEPPVPSRRPVPTAVSEPVVAKKSASGEPEVITCVVC